MDNLIQNKEMLGQYLTTIISTLLILCLPIKDAIMRSAISNALSHVVIIILEYFYNNTFHNFNIMRYLYIDNYVIIKNNNPLYEKFIELIYKNYTINLSGCQFTSDCGKYKMMIEELERSRLYDKFTVNNKEYDIKIQITNCSTNKQNDSHEFKDIKISSSAPMNILEAYIQNLMKKCNEKIVNNLLIHKPHIVHRNKIRYVVWKENTFKTNKTIKNTIVSDDVHKLFFEDIAQFLNNEQYYISKGLPYKRGYLLYGEAGCGKTSLIKAVANEYNIPIFTIDLSIFENNNELIKIINDINNLIANRQMHVVVFEDIDRSHVFNSRYARKTITDDCILNILDGLDEGYGRITVLTTNNLDILKSLQSLVRPGRIDRLINITFCTYQQLNQIMNLYLDIELSNEIKSNVKITPAKLIQIITFLNDTDKVIDLLNKYIDFSQFDIEKLLIHKNTLTKMNQDDNSDFTEDENEDDIEIIKEDKDKDNNKKNNKNKKSQRPWNIMLENKKIKLEKKKTYIDIVNKEYDGQCEKKNYY